MNADNHWFYRPLRQTKQIELQLSDAVISNLRLIAATAHPNETGGLLLGWWEGHVPTISAAIEVHDPGADRSQWSRLEHTATVAFTSAIKEANNPNLGYIGDWHSHPANIGASVRDTHNLMRISRQYSEALVLVVVRKSGQIDTKLAKLGKVITLKQLISPTELRR